MRGGLWWTQGDSVVPEPLSIAGANIAIYKQLWLRMLCWEPRWLTMSSVPIPSHARTHLLKPVHLSFSLLCQCSVLGLLVYPFMRSRIAISLQ